MADRLISALTALTTPAAGDYLPIVDVSEGADASKNKRITVEELFRSIPDGTVAAPSISFEGDPNTGFYRPAADTLAFVEGGAEVFRIDDSSRLLIGTNTARATPASINAFARLQLEGNNNNNSAFSITNTVDAASGRAANIRFARIRGTVNPVVVTDTLGQMSFWGYDGADLAEGASIGVIVESGVGAGSMPTRLAFYTSVNGAASPTERFRITNDGVIAHDQPTPVAANSTATLTIAQLKTGIITSTSAALTDLTLPTGTDTEAGFSTVYTNFTFEWSVINTGPSVVNVLANTTTHLVVGSGSVAAGTSGRFTTRRTATNTFTSYRLA